MYPIDNYKNEFFFVKNVKINCCYVHDYKCKICILYIELFCKGIYIEIKK